jgi:hypothetical protein
MNVKTHMKMLGLTVSDRVTGFAGVVSCVSFDLYGCVQAVVTPKANADGKLEDGKWFDITRLYVTSKMPVMPAPDFDKGYIAEGRKGAAEKPAGRLA